VSLEIKAYLDALPELQRGTVQKIRNAVRKVSRSFGESISPWGHLTFSTPKVWGLLTIVLHPKHANLQFANGAALATAIRQMEGTGKNLRHIKFPYDKPLDAALLTKAVRASLALPAKGMPGKKAGSSR
jgi:uncharacterized protein YdhG (YjbR/CyaY superfamily)